MTGGPPLGAESDTAVWLQLTAGRGPAECRLALAGLLPCLITEAQAKGLSAVIVDLEPDEVEPVSALVAVRGEEAASLARSWAGTIQWICRSPVRPNHGRKNWFVGVDVLEPPRSRDMSLREADVHFDTLRASGPGGQHVNRRESAVRATHRPSGLIVVAQEERSQHRNKHLALARLAARLAEQERSKGIANAKQRWLHHDQLERGNPTRVYEGPTFQRRR